MNVSESETFEENSENFEKNYFNNRKDFENPKIISSAENDNPNSDKKSESELMAELCHTNNAFEDCVAQNKE